MQLHELSETNLFDELSDQEQEVVEGGAGGSVSYSGSVPGGFYTYTNSGVYSKNGASGNGSYTFTTNNGTTYTVKWSGNFTPLKGTSYTFNWSRDNKGFEILPR